MSDVCYILKVTGPSPEGLLVFHSENTSVPTVQFLGIVLQILKERHRHMVTNCNITLQVAMLFNFSAVVDRHQ